MTVFLQIMGLWLAGQILFVVALYQRACSDPGTTKDAVLAIARESRRANRSTLGNLLLEALGWAFVGAVMAFGFWCFLGVIR